MIHSYEFEYGQDPWFSVLTFKGNGGSSDLEFGDRIPGIFVNKDGYLHFSTTKIIDFDIPINLNTWYNILIEQKFVHKKVKRKYERFNFCTFPNKQTY